MMQERLQTAVAMIYPPRCLTCGDTVDSDFGLCGPCWRDTSFIGGAICDCCGVPLPGEDSSDTLHCDDCLAATRPWAQGRAAMLYRDTGRKLVLALKHGDRQEIAKPAALWMANAVQDICPENTLIAPVPLHWLRLVKRRYNQSALLAKALAREIGLDCCPDLLQRTRRTVPLEGLGREERHSVLENTIVINPKRRHRAVGRSILLVDDVMTSGATLSATAQACLEGGTGPVRVVTLARVAKDT